MRLLLCFSKGFNDPFMCVKSAKKLLTDILSIISPVTSAFSMSSYEKYVLTRERSSLAWVNGRMSESDETVESSK